VTFIPSKVQTTVTPKYEFVGIFWICVGRELVSNAFGCNLDKICLENKTAKA
jgi:hypothetical protein